MRALGAIAANVAEVASDGVSTSVANRPSNTNIARAYARRAALCPLISCSRTCMVSCTVTKSCVRRWRGDSVANGNG